MFNTQVMVYFSLFGDEFPIDEVTRKLGVTPTKSYKRGDLIPNLSSTFYYKETSWDLGTDYQLSMDINNQLLQVFDKLHFKTEIINEIKKSYSLECKFFIVVKIEEGFTPALYFDKDFIKFTARIEAEIDIDLYANPFQVS